MGDIRHRALDELRPGEYDRAGTCAAELRGRVSAVFGLSFFGLMPIAGLVVTGFSDLIGMRTALAVASVIYANCRGLGLEPRRSACLRPARFRPRRNPKSSQVALTPQSLGYADDRVFHLLELRTPHCRR